MNQAEHCMEAILFKQRYVYMFPCSKASTLDINILDSGQDVNDRHTAIVEAEWSLLRMKNPEELLLMPIAMVNDEELLILSAGMSAKGAFSFFPGEA